MEFIGGNIRDQKCDFCLFEDVFDSWNKELWPGRSSPITPMSSLKWDAQSYLTTEEVLVTNDNNIYKKYAPVFFCIRDGAMHNIVGVNSGHKTENGVYRSRGLWVHPNYRNNGLSRKLLEQTIIQAQLENCTFIWTMPRATSLYAYEKVGFGKIGEWTNKYEFGPNCIAIHQLL